jgi:hypothetical protein
MASIYANGSKGHHKFTLELTPGAQDIANNKTPVVYSFKISPVQTSWNWYTWGASISYTITGKDKDGTVVLSVSGSIPDYDGYSTVTLKSGTVSVSHKPDGTQSLSYSFSVTDTSGQTYTCGNASASGTLALTTIPRATTPALSTTAVTMGSSVAITIAPASSTFKHKLRYSFGGLSSQVSGLSEGNDFTPAGNRTVTFTPPTSLGAEIPSTTSGTCTIYCYTYTSSGTHIGTTSKTLTISVPSYSLSASVAITGNNLLSGTYVSGKSTITAVITVPTTGLYGATIVHYSSTINSNSKTPYSGASFTSGVLYAGGGQYVETTVTDSRGKYVAVRSSTFTVYDYSLPYITALSAERQSDGTTVVVRLKGGTSPVNNKNTRNFSVTLNNVEKHVESTSYAIDAALTFTGIDTDKTFEVEATVYDYYTHTTKIAILPTVSVTMDFYHDGTGIAMGKVAEESGLLDVDWPIKSPSIPNLLGGYGTSVAEDADLNTSDYLKVGTYKCPLNSTVATLKNCPTSYAFKMTVSNLFHKDRVPLNDAGAYWYLVREIVNIYGHRYFQAVCCGPTGDWIYDTWCTRLDDYLVKDHITEQGTTGIWTYRKWSSGIAECWGIHTQTNVAINAPWGSLYESAGYAVDLPSGLFVDTPVFHILLTGTGQSGSGTLLETYSAGSSTQTPNMCAIRPAAATVDILNTSISAKGRWK